eukprot:m.35514 g.35514  ORF g.35514 m.35514 type:complete len:61 (-) comp6608_c0_seq1:2889-3071(-)
MTEVPSTATTQQRQQEGTDTTTTPPHLIHRNNIISGLFPTPTNFWQKKTGQKLHHHQNVH